MESFHKEVNFCYIWVRLKQKIKVTGSSSRTQEYNVLISIRYFGNSLILCPGDDMVNAKMSRYQRTNSLIYIITASRMLVDNVFSRICMFVCLSVCKQDNF